MNKASLKNELNKLRHYLKDLSRKGKLTQTEMTVHAYTITGMIEHIYALISTGAYHSIDDSLDKVFELIESARNTALHYNKSGEFSTAIENAKVIVESTPDTFSKTIVDNLNNFVNYPTSSDCLLIHQSDALKIIDGDDVNANTILVENIRTKEKAYVPQKNVVILENRLSGDVHYLVRFDNEDNVFYKVGENKTILTSTLKLYSQKFFVPGYINKKEKLVDIDKAIKKIVSKALENPYNPLSLNHVYGQHHYSLNAYKVLDEYLRTNIIDEAIGLSKFNIKTSSVTSSIKELNVNLDYNFEKDMLDNSTLRDLLYMEIYLKDYNAYLEKIREANEQGLEIDNYAKHAFLLEMYKRGPSNFSEQFIKSTKGFASFFYEYRNNRNILAHDPITDIQEKDLLIEHLELYSEKLFDIINSVYHVYSKDKRKYKYSYLPTQGMVDDGRLFTNKTDEYALYKHTGETVIIAGTKYLKLMNAKDLYIQVDGTIYIYNHKTESSYECIAPKNGARIVEIDRNGVVKKSHINPVTTTRGPINYDSGENSLLEAYNYLQHFPQADSKKFYKAHEIKTLPIITVYDAMGPAYNEPLKSVLLRRFSQKFTTRELLSACKCRLYEDLDKPIEILDKDDHIVATIYYGNIKKNGTITQVNQYGEEVEINHGKLTMRTTDTSKIITEVKLERNKR